MLSDVERQNLRNAIKDASSRKDARAAIAAAATLLARTGKPADAMFCASAFAGIANEIGDQAGARKLRTFIVRSVTVEPILPFLNAESVLARFVLDIQIGGYGSYVDELLNSSSALAKFQPDLVMLLLDAEELGGRLPELCADGIGANVDDEIEQCAVRIEKLLRSFRAGSHARLLLQGLAVPDYTSLGDVGDANLVNSLPHAIQRLNQRLLLLCRTVPDCVFFDVDRVAARHGRAHWRDTRMFLASRLNVSPDFFSAYSRSLVRSFSTLFRAPRKVLCTDLDNTLWGGVLGEDGVDGIATGSAFPGNCYLEYQKYLKQLSARGILLAIVSKNNVEDVREAFQTRSADMAVGLSDFVAAKIGWDEKWESIRQLSEELSLGLDSVVFVDDNPVECEAIRQRLPDVAVLTAPVTEPWKLVELLARQPFFDAAAVTADDLNRASDYRAQAQRAELAGSVGTREEFLGSLGIVCTFQSALLAPLSRSVQLLAKTNQFNLTTRRRSAAEVEEFASAPTGQAIVVRVRDRFGDAGVVGLALARNQGSSCVIDSLLLSCRVIGRGIETALLANIGEQAIRNGATRLVGEFIPTKKNAPCATFYPDHGFAQCDPPGQTPTGSTFYELDLTTSAPISPRWITLEGNETHELATDSVVSA